MLFSNKSHATANVSLLAHWQKLPSATLKFSPRLPRIVLKSDIVRVRVFQTYYLWYFDWDVLKFPFRAAFQMLIASSPLSFDFIICYCKILQYVADIWDVFFISISISYQMSFHLTLKIFLTSLFLPVFSSSPSPSWRVLPSWPLGSGWRWTAVPSSAFLGILKMHQQSSLSCSMWATCWLRWGLSCSSSAFWAAVEQSEKASACCFW